MASGGFADQPVITQDHTRGELSGTGQCLLGNVARGFALAREDVAAGVATVSG